MSYTPYPYRQPGLLVTSKNISDKIKAYDHFVKEHGQTCLQKTRSVDSIPRPSTQNVNGTFGLRRRAEQDSPSKYKSEANISNLAIGNPSWSFHQQQTTKQNNPNRDTPSKTPPEKRLQSSLQNIAFLSTGSTEAPKQQQRSNDENKSNSTKNRQAQDLNHNRDTSNESQEIMMLSTRGGIFQSSNSLNNFESLHQIYFNRENKPAETLNAGSNVMFNQDTDERRLINDPITRSDITTPCGSEIPTYRHGSAVNNEDKSAGKSEMKFTQGNSKKLVARRKSDSYQQHDVTSNYATNQPEASGSSISSAAYIKSFTRKARTKSLPPGNFPTVFELPEETHHGLRIRNDINDKETLGLESPPQSFNKQYEESSFSHTMSLSKSDTQMNRHLSEIDKTGTQSLKNVKDVHITISSPQPATSTGALSSPSSCSAQFNERKHIIESTLETLEDYQQDNDVCNAGLHYLELRRFRNAKDILDRTGMLIIKCYEKDGSTHLGYSLLSAYENTTKCIVGSVYEYASCVTGGSDETYTIMVDDAFGVIQFDGQQVDSWQTHIERTSTKRRKGLLKIIFILKRKNAIHCSDFLWRYENSVLDLSAAKHQLTPGEKEIIVRRCIGRKNSKRKRFKIEVYNDTIESIGNIAVSVGFLGMVELFLSKSSTIQKGADLFREPAISFYKQIDGFRQSKDETEKSIYLALAAVRFFNNYISSSDIAVLSQEPNQDMMRAKKNAKSSVDLLNCSRNTKRRNKYTVQPQIDVESYKVLFEVASQLNYKSNIGKRINDVAYRMDGVFLCKEREFFTFSHPCVMVAISISVGQIFPEIVVRSCSRDFFHQYVGTDMTFPNDEQRCIRIDLSQTDLCKAAFERLRQVLKDNDCRYFASHPIIRDARFLQKFSEFWDGQDFFGKIKALWNRRKAFVETLIEARDQSTDQSILIWSLEFPFFEQTSTHESRTLADWVLKQNKWIDYRHDNSVQATAVENKVIEKCCTEDWENVYMSLVGNFNLSVFTKECLFGAVNSGAVNIVKDILSTSKFSKEDYNKAMKDAMKLYTEERVPQRREILKSLQAFSDTTTLVASICESGDGKELAAVLKLFNIDVNAIRTEDGPITFLLALHNHCTLLQVAIEHLGADPFITYRGQMCVHKAAELGRLKVLRFLYSFDNHLVQQKDRCGRTPLHLAASKGHVNCVLFLLNVQDDVNVTDNDDQTALHKAASNPGSEIIHLLLEKGANVYIKDKNKETAIQIANRFKNEMAVRKMIGHARRKSTSMEHWMFLGNLFQ